jgi:LysM repeat protein
MLVKILNRFVFYIVYCLLPIFLIGCATVTTTPVPLTQQIKGVYHKVKKGQTLWRISKIYQVELEKLLRINRLSESSRIYVGQLIFIPGATKEIEDLTLEIDFINDREDFIWPVRGKIISYFGMKKDNVNNRGIYIQTKKNSAILAARSGKVAFCSEYLKGYGKIIIIDHLDGYSTVYAHNLNNLVKLNQLIKQGQVIARVDAGGAANNPELYFEVRKGHQPQNPFFYLP